MHDRPRFLLCSPRHFAVNYAINPWMDPQRPVDGVRALQQWERLRLILSEHADVLEVEPAADLPDMCFAANGGLVHGPRFVASRFRHAQRRGEEQHYLRWFEQRNFDCIELPDGILFEGAGDALFDRGGERLWMGCGQRSDAAAAPALEQALGIEVLALRLIDPRFYHLDTCFSPLASGHVLYFPAAFDADSRALIESRYAPHRRIAVSETDALGFACNAIDLADTLLCPNASTELVLRLNEAGVRVMHVDVSEFLRGGGAAKCLALALSLPRAAIARPPRHGSSRRDIERMMAIHG